MKSEIISIVNNHDFRRIYKRGKYYISPFVVIYIFKNRYRNVRIGITASKKTGNAVKRNRSRRIIREAVRALWPQMKSGYDYVFVARAKTPFGKSTDMERTIRTLLKKAGMYQV